MIELIKKINAVSRDPADFATVYFDYVTEYDQRQHLNSTRRYTHRGISWYTLLNSQIRGASSRIYNQSQNLKY